MPAATKVAWSTPLAALLSNSGLAQGTVNTLETYYPYADPAGFLAGLDWLMTATRTQSIPQGARPTEAPWDELAQAVVGVPPGDMLNALLAAMANWAPDLQAAIVQALNERQEAWEAQAAGKPVRRRHCASAEYLKVLADLGYTFRMNELNDIIELNGRPISDSLAALIRRQMRDRGYYYVEEIQDAYTAEAYLNRYHPVRAYLDSLAWDGQPHIAHLLTYLQDRDHALPIFLRKWLIGAVARVREGAQNAMLVLDGPQGIGKSTLVKWLASVVDRELYMEGPIHPENKDDLLRLAAKWIWEVSELGSTTRKADVEALKAFLTMNQVTVRRPYGHFDMVKPALASFIGTLNDQNGFLVDPTGNRRFWTVKLTRIDFAYSQECDPHQVWAEANAAYLAGASWELTADERAFADSINSSYEMDDPIEGLLKKYFRVDPPDTQSWTPTAEILAVLEQNGLHGPTRTHAMALSNVMIRLGCERRKQNNQYNQRVWGYVGVRPL